MRILGHKIIVSNSGTNMERIIVLC
jgi:hypothetical protein